MKLSSQLLETKGSLMSNIQLWRILVFDQN